VSVTIKRGKTSFTAIVDNINKAQADYVAVGLFSKGAGKDYDNNLAMRMAHLELGSARAHLPSRPVFQTTLSDRKSEIKKFMKDLWSDVLLGKIAKKKAYGKLGKEYEGMLKAQFTRRKFAALSPFYKIRPSGRRVTPSSIPLLDTNKMRDSITYKVVE